MGYDDDHRTPPPMPPVGGSTDVLEHRLTSVELKFSELRAMAGQNKDLLIETVGKSGSNGRLGVLAEKLNTIQSEIEDLTKMFEEQRKFISKIVLAMLVTSSLGAGGAQVAMQLLGGGW
tara:strand:- start:196 stop:552 length:357 start_codon:yes stop_codon:yes gene_type:complete